MLGGRARFEGWPSAWSNQGLSGVAWNNVLSMSDSSIRLYAGRSIGGTALSNFVSQLKSTPGVWVQHNTPLNVTAVTTIVSIDDDLVYLGTSLAANADFFRFTHSGGFTDMLFPEGGTSDTVAKAVKTPDPDILLVGNQATAAGGSAALWTFRISTSAWTKIAGTGINGSWTANASSRSVPGIQVYAGQIYVIVNGGSTNNLDVWVSNTAWNAWTRIGGAGLNGSWATGTKGSGTLVVVNGVVYVGTGGASAGDGEAWKLPIGGSWSQIGGDGINGSWTAGTKTSANRLTALANKVVFGTGGTVAGDSQVWQYDVPTDTWVQLAVGTWSRLSTGVLYVDIENNLYAGVGNNSVGTMILEGTPPGRLTRGGAGFQFQLYKVRV